MILKQILYVFAAFMILTIINTALLGVLISRQAKNAEENELPCSPEILF